MIEIDFNNVMAHKVGLHGLTDQDMDKGRERLNQALEKLSQERESGERPYLDLPTQDTSQILKFVEDRKDHFDDFLVLGIGGSALGAVALRTALCAPYHNQLSRSRRKQALRLHVLDHTDPERVFALLKTLKPKKTLVNLISKSGATAEVMALYLIVREWLENNVADWRDHLVLTTDPQKGFLRKFGSENKIPTFEIPPAVGGRFSVLSPVGLIPAAFAGIDIQELLSGAKKMTDQSLQSQLRANPAAILALLHVLLDQERYKKISVWMPYVFRLRDLSDWYCQLWAESLGKEHTVAGRLVHTGQTPVRSFGVTDQHSQVQLYVEGPNDKVITFLSVKRLPKRGRIPETQQGDEGLDYLSGSSLQKLTETERLGTEIALTRALRPNYHIMLSKISPETIGALLQMTMIQTSLAGYILGINPYDQPGVEYGKVATFARLGRQGYEDELEKMKPYLSRKSFYVYR